MDRQETINDIVYFEWGMFQLVNEGGPRASCQESPQTFAIMRYAEYAPWSDEALASYLQDLIEASANGRNLVEEKYVRMMETTAPERFASFEGFLPPTSEEKKELANQITDKLIAQKAELGEKYPRLAGRGRPLNSTADDAVNTSVETYQRCELLTYSEKTLRLLNECIDNLSAQGEMFVEKILEDTVKSYGCDTLEQAEQKLSSNR